MKNQAKQKAGDNIARVTIEPYANIWTAFDRRAVQYFRKNVEAYIWVLKRDGSIISLKGDNLPRVKLSIDIEEPDTVTAFNSIPKYMDSDFAVKDVPPLILKVDAFPEGDEDFPYWTMGDDGDNTDTIIFNRDSGMALKSTRDFWSNFNPEAFAEIENIDRGLPDIPQYFKGS